MGRREGTRNTRGRGRRILNVPPLHDKALSRYEHVLETMARVLNDVEPSFLSTMKYMVLLLIQEWRHDEVLTLNGEVLEKKKVSLGVDNPSTLIAMSN